MSAMVRWVKSGAAADGSPLPFDRDDVEHLCDWIDDSARDGAEWLRDVDENGVPLKIANSDFARLKHHADRWFELKNERNAARLKAMEIEITTGEGHEERIMDLPDGHYAVRLISKEAYELEGRRMHHCVASYHGRERHGWPYTVYSVRGQDGKPRITVGMAGAVLDQAMGPCNGKASEDDRRKFVEPLCKKIWDIKDAVFPDYTNSLLLPRHDDWMDALGRAAA